MGWMVAIIDGGGPDVSDCPLIRICHNDGLWKLPPEDGRRGMMAHCMVLGKASEGLLYCLYDIFLLTRSLGSVD